jgi:hypothetical protein
VGFLVWSYRQQLPLPRSDVGRWQETLQSGLGFDRAGESIVRLVTFSAASLQRTQSGHLSWNIAGLVLCLGLLLVTLLSLR